MLKQPVSPLPLPSQRRILIDGPSAVCQEKPTYSIDDVTNEVSNSSTQGLVPHRLSSLYSSTALEPSVEMGHTNRRVTR